MITIVGVGALGSHVSMFLRNMDQSIKCIDYDKIETKNVMSQFHSRNAVGKNKAQAHQQLMSFLFNKKIDVIPHKLTNDNVSQLLDNSKLVIDCLDNGDSRRVVQAYVRKNNINALHGALNGDGTFGCAVWDEQFTIDDATPGQTATCENGEHLPFIAVVSSYIALAAQQFLKGRKKNSYRIHSTGIIKT